MAWIVFVPGSYTLIQSVWVQSKVLVKAAAKWEFSGLFLMRQEWKTVQHSRSFPSATLSPFPAQSSVLSLKQAAPGRIGTFWKFGVFCHGLCDWRSTVTHRAEGTDSESHKLKESRNVLLNTDPGQRGGGFSAPHSSLQEVNHDNMTADDSKAFFPIFPG